MESFLTTEFIYLFPVKLIIIIILEVFKSKFQHEINL